MRGEMCGMKHKKLFAILTLVCFLFTLVPVAAFAETGSTVQMQYDDRVSVAELFGEEIDSANVEVSTGSILSFDGEEITAVGCGESTITVGEKEITVVVNPAKVNIVLIDGQSNAMGRAGTMNSYETTVPDLSCIPEISLNFLEK